MAVTSIWAVHGSVKDLIDYAENPDKTEKRYFVSGVNCLPELAYERMTATKKRYGKCDGIVAYHAYHSFKPGEVTPEQCHKLGVELAKRLWGDRFEVVVASHSDHDHLHNHFVINSVSFKDGLKIVSILPSWQMGGNVPFVWIALVNGIPLRQFMIELPIKMNTRVDGCRVKYRYIIF